MPLKLSNDSPEIDFSEWEFSFEYNTIEEWMKRSVAETFLEVFNSSDAIHLGLRSRDDNLNPTDSLEFCVSLLDWGGRDYNVRFSQPASEFISELEREEIQRINDGRFFLDESIDAASMVVVSRLRDLSSQISAAADRIEQALNQGNNS